MRRGWLYLFRGLGESLLELLRAEVRALTADLQATGKRLASAIVLFLVAAFFAFWSCGVLAYLGIELLSLVVSRAAAAGIVLGALLLLTLIFVWLGYRRLQRLEAPAATVRRRLDDSLGWWETRVLELDADEDRDGEDREE